MTDTLMPLIKKFLPYAQEKMGFKDPPTLFLRSDAQNAVNPLGKTAFYDPQAKSITLYITKRHPKDVMRSLSHELIHHTQNCNGKFDNVNGGEMGEGYAQNDDHLREMEREAYEMGNLCFRDWEDSIKNTIYFEHLQKGAKKMSLKDWKNKELTSLLSEAWGFKFNTLQEFDEFNGTGEVQEETGRLDRADEPPGGWTTTKDPGGRKRPLRKTVPVGEEDPEDYDEEDLLAMQHGNPEGSPLQEEEAEEEEVQEASNPRAGNEDRQRPGRNPADRMHEAEDEEDDADEKQPRHGRVDKPRGKGFKPRGKGLSEAQLNALVKEAIKKALTTLQKG